jgi:hypothetical protein
MQGSFRYPNHRSTGYSILYHLGLWKQYPDPHERKTKAPAAGPVVIEDYGDGWPGDESPSSFARNRYVSVLDGIHTTGVI